MDYYKQSKNIVGAIQYLHYMFIFYENNYF